MLSSVVTSAVSGFGAVELWPFSKGRLREDSRGSEVSWTAVVVGEGEEGSGCERDTEEGSMSKEANDADCCSANEDVWL